MKIINLSDSAKEELLGLPETGMGFQLVEAIFWGEQKQFLVFNSETAVDITSLGLSAAEDITNLLRNEQAIISAMQGAVETIFASPAPHSFKLISSRIGSSISTSSVTPIAATPSSLVKHDVLTNNRKFHRFSAFNPDRRVNPTTGDFAPGTYATVDSEVPFVPSGFAAVGRFALPNNLPASHHYVIKAPVGASVSFGTVAPAFSQAGGGVEAFFSSAVPNQLSPPVPPSQLPDE